MEMMSNVYRWEEHSSIHFFKQHVDVEDFSLE